LKTKINHVLSLLVLSSLFVACGGGNHKDKPSDKPSFTVTQLNNEGSICLYGMKNNDIKVFYFPLNSSCSSSSANRWSNKKLAATASLRRSLKGSVIEIEASATHRRSHSGIATADCAGSGVQSKRLSINGNHRFEVSLGKYKLGNVESSKGMLFCRTVDKKGNISPAPQLHQYVRMVARLEP